MSDNDILVSVVIPAFKASDTLEKAVNSALQMEHMEVVVVDDCSPDATFELVQKLGQLDARVRPFRLEKNSGVSAARNYGFSVARGKWIAVLDSDDWFEPGRLEKLIYEATKANAQMAVDNQYFFDKQANQIAGTAFPQKNMVSMVGMDEFLDNSNATKHFDYGMLKPIFLAEFIRANGLEYYVKARIGEDYYLLLSFFACGGKAILDDTPYYTYVQTFGTISKAPQEEGRKPYNHHYQKIAHAHFMEELKGKFSSKQLSKLEKRGREIDALIDYYDLREALKKKDITRAIKIILGTNGCFWAMIKDKLLARMLKGKQ